MYHFYFYDNLTNVANINKSFTAAFREELLIMLEQNLPPHHISDATLLWEI